MFEKKYKGFTLMELIVAIGIFVIIAFAANWLFVRGLRYNNVIWEQLTTQSEGRRAIQQVVDIVRKAEESSVGSYPIELADEYELIIFANVDDDSFRERVRFWLDGTTFKRGIVQPSGNPLNYSGAEDVVELAHDVVNITKPEPLFLYYNESYTGTEDPLSTPASVVDVKVVRIRLEVEKDPTETPIPLQVESTVHIRNLKSN